MASSRRYSPLPSSRHILSQLKFVGPGGAITYYLSTLEHVQATLAGDAGLGRSCATASVFLGLLTVSLFLYVLSMPWIRGEEPDFRSWRQSGTLSLVIPALTASIVIGWSLLTLTLGQWSELGYLRGVVAASGLYALTFGLMGLIPAPKIRSA